MTGAAGWRTAWRWTTRTHVERLALIDIAPTATMYASTNREFATRYFWWFFLIQPFDVPEHLIGADPEYFLRQHIGGQLKNAGAANEELFQEYLRCYRDPATIHAICEDYRAAASIDLEHDAADAGRKVEAPLLASVGRQGRGGQPVRRAGNMAREGGERVGPGARLRAHASGRASRRDRHGLCHSILRKVLSFGL